MQTNKHVKTFDQVLTNAATSAAFRTAYDEELTRLRLASEIKRLRTERNLTQKSMAERANMPQSVIARIESGKCSISVGTLDRIAKVLGKEVQLA